MLLLLLAAVVLVTTRNSDPPVLGSTPAELGDRIAPLEDAAVRVVTPPGAVASQQDRQVAAVVADLDAFWGERLRADFGRSPAPLTGGLHSMDSTAENGSALCVPDPASILGNTYYCDDGDGIVYDSAALVPVLLGHYGPGGLVSAFAHEYGHALQARLGPALSDRNAEPDRYPQVLIEAQADCYAGVFLQHLTQGGSRHLQLPAAALLQAVAPLLDFRDPADGRADDPAAHGLAIDRLQALLTGIRGNATGCREMAVGDLELSLGSVSAPPSFTPRFANDDAVRDAAVESIATFAAVDPSAVPAPDPADLAAARPYGQFAIATASALASGRQRTGNSSGAACFAGAWASSRYGAPPAELGGWPGDADEAVDLLRSRPGATFDELVAFHDGFRNGLAGCP